MKRLEIAVMLADRDPFLRSLQRLGAVELAPVSDDRLRSVYSKDAVNELDKKLAVVNDALGILYEYAPPKGGMLGMLSGRTPTTEKEYNSSALNADEYYKTACRLCELKRSVSDSKAEIIRAKTLFDNLSVWKDLDIPLGYKGTKKTVALIGTLPAFYTDETLQLALAERATDDHAVVEVVSALKQQTAVAVICHKESLDRVYSALREMGFAQPSGVTDKPISSQLQELTEQISCEQRSIDEKEAEIKENADKRDCLSFLFDHLTVERDRLEALSNVKQSAKAVIMQGYAPFSAEEKIRDLADKYGAAAVFSEPDEDEEVPVLLKNGRFSEPVEAITEMYAMPGKKDIDPSSVMAFFYYLLFGMMLSDAGYGLVMVIGTALALKKTTVEGNLRRSLKMFFYCGISTVFWGALFGSWFGDIVPVICKEFFGITYTADDMAIWFEPIKDPITLLLFSFIIGICHLFLGLITAGVMQWKDGKRWDAVFDTVPIILLVLGAAPLAAGVLVEMPSAVNTVAGYVAIVGVVLIILTSSRSSKNIIARLLGGLYGLYNIASGYLSDILSYSRLLALGLATGSIAGVINMLGVMPSNLVLKAILLTVVFIVGHALNMAINVLGAYVHTNRLQFVELFSKFYEGGGKAFEPLKMNTKYIKLKEENKNG